MAQKVNYTLLDCIETKLKETKRVPFVSRIVLVAKITDRQHTIDTDIADYFEQIIPELGPVRRGVNTLERSKKVLPSGLLLIMPNAIVTVLEVFTLFFFFL
jgi:hypothetical protein